MDMKEVNDLIGYGVKEGLIDDSAENWSDAEKIDFYHKCELAENNKED